METGDIVFMSITYGIGLVVIAWVLKRYWKIHREKKHQAKVDALDTLLWVRDFDPEECRECHLPGDCPLCGAK